MENIKNLRGVAVAAENHQAEGKDQEPVKEKGIPAEVLMALGLGWYPWWNTEWNKRCQSLLWTQILRIKLALCRIW